MSLFISKKSDGLGKMWGIGLVIVVIFMIKLWADVYGFATGTTISTRDEMIIASKRTALGLIFGLALMGCSMGIRHLLNKNKKNDNDETSSQ